MSLGEVYVLNDGGEVDLDLGNYERYLDVTLSRDNNITTGKIYREVIEKEVRALLSVSIMLLTGHLEERRISREDGTGTCQSQSARLVLSVNMADCTTCNKCHPRLD